MFRARSLAFNLPPHFCHDSFAISSKEPPQSVNIFSDNAYSDDSGYEAWKREGVAHQLLMKRSWELFGPIWRGRPIGTIDFALTLHRHDALPKPMSCFNPKDFEQVVMRNLYYGGPCRPNHQVQQAPVSWQLRKPGGATAIFFEKHRINPPEVLATSPHHDTYFSSCFFIPIDQTRYLKMNFRYLGYAPVEPCLAAMNSIRDGVCNSVSLQLGTDAQAQLAKTRQQWPEAKASAKRDIEPWVYPEWRESDDFEGRIIITKPGSPPPAWQV